MSKTRTPRAWGLGAAVAIIAVVAGLACTPSSSSSQCGGVGPVLGPVVVEIVYACNLPPPSIVVITGPCEEVEGEGIHGVGVGTCVVEIDFPNGLKFSAEIQFSALPCQTPYVASVGEIVVGDVPMCDEAGGEPPQCSCLSYVACGSDALCIDAGPWDGAVYTP